MFNLFRKQVHEPSESQIKDILKYPEDFAGEILAGEDCDQISGSHGDFGSITNPIPVNGAIGEIKYLAKLRGKTGNALFFHRISSDISPVTSNSVDHYEVVCLDATQWSTFYFDMYHPRRSNQSPPDYLLVPYDKSFGMDLPFGYGVNKFVENFPYDLPDAIQKVYRDKDGVFARHAREWLAKGDFSRP